MNQEESINEKQFAYWPVKALKVKKIKGEDEIRHCWIWRKHYFINGETEVWIKGKMRHFETVNIVSPKPDFKAIH